MKSIPLTSPTARRQDLFGSVCLLCATFSWIQCALFLSGSTFGYIRLHRKGIETVCFVSSYDKDLVTVIFISVGHGYFGNSIPSSSNILLRAAMEGSGGYQGI